jgi:hypothetical protein
MMLFIQLDRFIYQLIHGLPPFGTVIIDKFEHRDRSRTNTGCYLAANKAGSMVERIDGFFTESFIQHTAENDSIAQIAAEFYSGKGTKTHARIIELISNDFSQLAANLFRHALAAIEFSWHLYVTKSSCSTHGLISRAPSGFASQEQATKGFMFCYLAKA